MAQDVKSRSKCSRGKDPKQQGAHSSKRNVADSARLLTPTKLEEQQQRKHGPKEPDQGEEKEEEEGGSLTPTTMIDLRRSLGIATADMRAVLEHRELVMERRLSLPEEHPRSNSNEEGQTDQEESDLGDRSDRSDSIEIRRTDAPQFAVGRESEALHRTKRYHSLEEPYAGSNRLF